jgi:TPR repeat protein
MPISSDAYTFNSLSTYLLGFVLVGCLVSAQVVRAETYTTAFGFDVELPDQWIMLTRQTLAEDYAGEDMNSLGLIGSFASAEAAAQTLQGIREGRYQYFFYRTQGAAEFIDHISLRLAPREVVPPGGLNSLLCRQVETNLPMFLEQEVDLQECNYDYSGGIEHLDYRFTTDTQATIEYRSEFYLSTNVELLLSGERSAGPAKAFDSAVLQFANSIGSYFSDLPTIIELSLLDYDSGDFTSAREKLERLSLLGDHEAEQRLGVLYQNGEGVDQDYGRAREFYESASLKGNLLAATNLAQLYSEGLGVEQDLEKAAELVRIASEAGVITAQKSYATMLMQGQGVAQSSSDALYWYLRAAMQGDEESGNFLLEVYQQEGDAGNAEAMRMLAALYLEGAGIAQNIDLGMEYLERATRAGSETAQSLLVLIYSDGRYGIEVDREASQRWRDF